MGKRNQQKRREAERQQSISGGKKKVRTGGLNRKERQNLVDFGTADGGLVSLMEGEDDQAYEGRAWTFDSNNQVISRGAEEDVQAAGVALDEDVTLLGATTPLSSVQLGKKKLSASPQRKPCANPFAKLLSNLRKAKKPSVEGALKVGPPVEKDVSPEPEKEPKIEQELQDDDYIRQDGGVVQEDDTLQDEDNELDDEDIDNELDDEEIERDEESDAEEDLVQVSGSVYKTHFGDKSYGEKELLDLVALATDKRWVTQAVYPVGQATASDPHIFLSTLEGQAVDVDALIKYSSASAPPLVLEQLALKPRLCQSWRQHKGDLEGVVAKFFYHLLHYRDVFFPLLTPQNGDSYKAAYVLHAPNHVLKTRDHILKNNFKRAKAQANGSEASEVKDSSFTRPKVLILLPFRSAALKVVNLLFELSGCEQLENRKRFLTEFSLPEGEEDPIARSRAPEDHKFTFAGNTDDCFKIGIKVTRNSDIIVASPLGLRLVVGDPELASKGKRKDRDFLSSLEMLVLDQADHLLMQNWDHTTHILRHSNVVPKDAHGCDFSRIKSWYLNNHAIHLRQTILLSQMATPELNHLFHRSLSNVAGQVRFRAPNAVGTILDTLLPARHTFHRVTCRNHAEADDVRFNYFRDSILPAIRRKIAAGGNVLLFIPSYFDFTRVRNYLAEHEYTFGQVSEYTDKPNMTRDRMAFASSKIRLLLYTGRCHFYRRFKSKGADQIVFYGLPDYGSHYPELINSANPPNPHGLDPQVQVTSLFTIYDTLKLERILGMARTQKACHGVQSILVFS
ncbi:rRNA-binding ribosome biosynthesis protein utp25 [Massospora cicadina]|nr:rRNA-binding ribosome biosynthesis protein utp25 [Massospora cicadina]